MAPPGSHRTIRLLLFCGPETAVMQADTASHDPMGESFVPSAKQVRQRDHAADVFSRYWTLDMKNSEYRRKSEGKLIRGFQLLVNRRQSLFGMYWYTKRLFHGDEISEYMPFHFPIEHDEMPIPGYSRKYALNEKYTVRQKDRKFLTGGPLYDRGEGRVIVVPFPARQSVRRFIVASVVPVVGFLGSLASLVALALYIWA